ncbi:hypothetical protein AOB46_16830 [Chryseobacterium indologenes]|uniref:Uncharacterized protein n=2 Tax=Chryseobacterium indologenes TaxID=253 RepID=A0A0N0IV01_CHRID|nr:hypothetical protein AOB46_16830 [Chryseobacterium indologenes]
MKIYLKQICMIGNIKYLLFFLLCFSCQNREKKTALGNELISENLPILLDNLDYFKTIDNPVVGVYQFVGEIKQDQSIVIKKFQEKYNLSNEKILNSSIKLEKIQKKINNYSVFLDTDNSFKKRKDTIKVSFVNFIISKNNQYASIEVVKSLGNGAKFEIYYFKQVNGKWIFDGKQLIAVG